MPQKTLPRLCEPILYLPQNVDVKALREKFETKVKAAEEKEKEGEESAKKLKIQEPIDIKILPVFDRYSNYTKNKLSLKRNIYLCEKYNKFLDNPEEKVVIVRRFSDLKTLIPKAKPMSLNGKFYDIHNKLAPTPHIPDPRQY